MLGCLGVIRGVVFLVAVVVEEVPLGKFKEELASQEVEALLTLVPMVVVVMVAAVVVAAVTLVAAVAAAILLLGGITGVVVLVLIGVVVLCQREQVVEEIPLPVGQLPLVVGLMSQDLGRMLREIEFRRVLRLSKP